METAPQLQKAAVPTLALGPLKDQNATASVDIDIESLAEDSPLTSAFLRFADLASLIIPHEYPATLICSSTTGANLDFRPTPGSHLTIQRQAPNILQIVYNQPAATSTVAKASCRKISSLPIALASFFAKVSVKDLEPNHVACVELSLTNPGCVTNRFVVCTIRLHFFFLFRILLN